MTAGEACKNPVKIDAAVVGDGVDAGFSEAQVLDVITAAALKTLSNYSNHITNPALNAELEGFAWNPESRESKAS